MRLALALVTLGAVLATTLVAVLVVTGTGPPSPEERARAVELARQEVDSPVLRAAVADCLRAPAAYDVSAALADETRRAACLEAMTPSPAAYLGRPPLQVPTVAAFDMLLLGLLATGLAGVAGLVLGTVAAPRQAAAAGAAIGLATSAAAWAVVATALVARGQPSDLTVSTVLTVPLLQVARIGVLTALAAAVGTSAVRRLGGVAPAVLVLVLLLAIGLLPPADVLDVIGGWITWSW